MKVRGVQVHGRKQPDAVAGQRTAINLAGVEVEEISRGQALVTPGAFEETRLADATVELLPDAKPLESLRNARGKGRNDYPVHVLWGAVVLRVRAT